MNIKNRQDGIHIRDKNIMSDYYYRQIEFIQRLSGLITEKTFDTENLIKACISNIPLTLHKRRGICVYILMNNREYVTCSSKNSVSEIMSPVIVSGQEIGRIEIRYQRKSRTNPDNTVFIEEDKNYINTITGLLGLAYEKQQQNISREIGRFLLDSFLPESDQFLLMLDMENRIMRAGNSIASELGFSIEYLCGNKVDIILSDKTFNPSAMFMENDNSTIEIPSPVNLITKDGSGINFNCTVTKIPVQPDKHYFIITRTGANPLDLKTAGSEDITTLRKILGGTIQSVCEAIEVRDPYTAGHQRRVSDLARHIASKMGLPRQMIEGIRTAGNIHDIGKIAIPSDLLSKPSRLLDIEFELIKRHTSTGFQILSSIDFPWPVAAMVLQHHERIDGSGYPLGLEGDMMLLEAKVLAVADVVEAMATHRPYRPSLGILESLEEIRKNRGILYEPDVVDACISLFNDDAFEFIEIKTTSRPF